MIDDYVFEMRTNALNQLIYVSLLNQQAEQLNLTKERYIEEMGFSEDGIQNYERIFVFLDSLKQLSEIEIRILPKYFKEVPVELLLKNTIHSGNGINHVYYVSDYNCPHCKEVKKKFDKIVKSNPNVNFHYVYHSDYVDDKALFAYACGLQGHFTECFEWLFTNDLGFIERNSLLEFAYNLGLDISELEFEMNDEQLLRQFVANRKILIDHGVNKVPCFIVNNKLLISGNPIMYLQNIMNHEFKN